MATKTSNELNLALRAKARELGRVPTPAEREAVKRELGLEANTKGNGYRSFSQADLFGLKLKPLEYIVAGLLVSPGMILFSGKKKHLKTLLMLILALAVAEGKEFLGRQTKKGFVLFYCLEDGTRRLLERLRNLQADPNLPIRWVFETPPLDIPEGMTELESNIIKYRPALTVIDTKAAATSRDFDENRASDNASLMNEIHALALKYETTIIIVAHHGKKSYFDAGFDARGSSATPSATDANLSIYKAGDNCFDLKIEGRDIPDSELRLDFDPVSYSFSLRGDSRTIRRAEVEDSIMELVNELKEVDVAIVGKHLNMSPQAARDYLNRMVANKMLVSKHIKTETTHKVLYSLPENEVTPLAVLQSIDSKNETKVTTVTSETSESKETTVSKPIEDCKIETTVTPISEVKAKEIASDVIQVAGFKILGQTEGFKCKDTSGYCDLQSKYTKQPFHCGYTPGNSCPHWSKANE
jgi:hypothetical protein